MYINYYAWWSSMHGALITSCNPVRYKSVQIYIYVCTTCMRVGQHAIYTYIRIYVRAWDVWNKLYTACLHGYRPGTH